MTSFTSRSTAAAAAMLVLLLQAAPVQAQQTRTWVSGTGNDSSPTCGRTTPCLTFAGAIAKTNAGGEINCLDAGDFGILNIGKSISIICDNTEAGIPSTAGNSIAITAGANGIITLRGLDLNGAGSGTSGIAFFTGAVLHIQKVQIRNFSALAGILFQPDSYAELYVTDSYITGNGPGGGSGGGIFIRPQGTASANVFIERVQLENNSAGIIVDGSISTGVAVNAVITDSAVAGSAGNGVSAITSAGHAAVSVVVDRTKISGNFAYGINANGVAASGIGSAEVLIGNSMIVNNVTGVGTSGMGIVQSFKTNAISGNLTDGTPIPAFPGPGGTPLQ